jgi:hypothetical protein
MDNHNVGHTYLEFSCPDVPHGDFYGYYPKNPLGKLEVLAGQGMVKNDKERFERYKKDEKTKLVSKEIDLTAEGYNQALKFVKEAKRHPPFYVLAGNNCVDFIQSVYETAKGEEAGNFTQLYTKEELSQLSYVAVYAEKRYSPEA